MVAVGNMVSNPKEKVFIVYVYHEVYNDEYRFAQMNLYYTANSVEGLNCKGDPKTNKGSCVFIIVGAGMKMIEFTTKRANITISQYVNYKSYADYKSMQVLHGDAYFVCFAFSPTLLKYALLLYSTNYNQNVYLHSFLDLDIGQNPILQNFKYGINKKLVTPPSDKVSDSKYTLGFIQVQSTKKMYIYSVNQLSIITSKTPHDMDRKQKNELENLKVNLNDGDLVVTLKEVYSNIDTGLGLCWVILIIVIIAIIVFGSLFGILVFCLKKTQAEREQDEKLKLLEKTEEKNEKEQKQYWVENLTPQQLEAIEKQKEAQLEEELQSRLMNMSMNTIDEFENAVVC